MAAGQAGRWAAGQQTPVARRPSPVARRPPSLPRHGQPPGLASTMPAGSAAAAIWHSPRVTYSERRPVLRPPAAHHPTTPPLAQGRAARQAQVPCGIVLLYCTCAGATVPACLEPGSPGREPWRRALEPPDAAARASPGVPDGVMCFARRRVSFASALEITSCDAICSHRCKWLRQLNSPPATTTATSAPAMRLEAAQRPGAGRERRYLPPAGPSLARPARAVPEPCDVMCRVR